MAGDHEIILIYHQDWILKEKDNIVFKMQKQFYAQNVHFLSDISRITKREKKNRKKRKIFVKRPFLIFYSTTFFLFTLLSIYLKTAQSPVQGYLN